VSSDFKEIGYDIDEEDDVEKNGNKHY